MFRIFRQTLPCSSTSIVKRPSSSARPASWPNSKRFTPFMVQGPIFFILFFIVAVVIQVGIQYVWASDRFSNVHLSKAQLCQLSLERGGLLYCS